MLMYSLPLYEAKYSNDDLWQEISELELMDELYRTYKKVTPAIKEMIRGNEVKTPYGCFRLKARGGEPISDSQQSWPRQQNLNVSKNPSPAAC
jgi:hypothetical protein